MSSRNNRLSPTAPGKSTWTFPGRRQCGSPSSSDRGTAVRMPSASRSRSPVSRADSASRVRSASAAAAARATAPATFRRSRAEASLLRAAADHGRQLRRAVHDQSTHSRGGADLVTCQAQCDKSRSRRCRAAEHPKRQRQMAPRCHRIQVQWRAGFRRAVTERSGVVDRAHLIVCHERGCYSSARQCVRELRGIDAGVRVDADPTYGGSLVGQCCDGLDRGMVFGIRKDNGIGAVGT